MHGSCILDVTCLPWSERVLVRIRSHSVSVYRFVSFEMLNFVVLATQGKFIPDQSPRAEVAEETTACAFLVHLCGTAGGNAVAQLGKVQVRGGALLLRLLLRLTKPKGCHYHMVITPHAASQNGPLILPFHETEVPDNSRDKLPEPNCQNL